MKIHLQSITAFLAAGVFAFSPAFGQDKKEQPPKEKPAKAKAMLKFEELEKKITLDKSDLATVNGVVGSYAPGLKKAMPAVVTIFSSREMPQPEERERNPQQEELFRRMFPDLPENIEAEPHGEILRHLRLEVADGEVECGSENAQSKEARQSPPEIMKAVRLPVRGEEEWHESHDRGKGRCSEQESDAEPEFPAVGLDVRPEKKNRLTVELGKIEFASTATSGWSRITDALTGRRAGVARAIGGGGGGHTCRRPAVLKTLGRARILHS